MSWAPHSSLAPWRGTERRIESTELLVSRTGCSGCGAVARWLWALRQCSTERSLLRRYGVAPTVSLLIWAVLILPIQSRSRGWVEATYPR